MKKLELRTLLFYLVLTSMALISVASCVNKQKKESKSILDQINQNIDSRIDSQILTEVVESNLKVIKISSAAPTKNISDNTKNILKEIEDEQRKLNASIKKIAKQNLIIIPDTLYDVETLVTSSNENEYDHVYLSEVENSLKDEIKKFEQISKSATNIDLKIFSVQVLAALNSDIKKLNEEIN